MLCYTFLIKEHFWGLQTVPETATCSISEPNPAPAMASLFFHRYHYRTNKCCFFDWSALSLSWILGIQMYLCNREHYGYLPIPLKPHQTLQDDVETLIHVQIEAMSEWSKSLWWLLFHCHCVHNRHTSPALGLESHSHQSALAETWLFICSFILKCSLMWNVNVTKSFPSGSIRPGGELGTAANTFHTMSLGYSGALCWDLNSNFAAF